ncbi:hypothetical protein RCL1_002240 [Eukaryota sp. TZLM3-RCL]
MATRRTPTRLLAPKVINSYEDLKSLLALSFDIYKFTYENPQSLFSTDVSIPQFNIPPNVAVFFHSRLDALIRIQEEVAAMLQASQRWRTKDSEVELFATFLDPNFGIDGLVFFLEVWGRLYSHCRNQSTTKSVHFLREVRINNDICRHLASLIFDSKQLASVKPSFWREREKTTGGTGDGSVLAIVFLKRALAEFEATRENSTSAGSRTTVPISQAPKSAPEVKSDISPSLSRSPSMSPRRHPLSYSETIASSPPSPPDTHPMTPPSAQLSHDELVSSLPFSPNSTTHISNNISNLELKECSSCCLLREEISKLNRKIDQSDLLIKALVTRMDDLEKEVQNQPENQSNSRHDDVADDVEELRERIMSLEASINELIDVKDNQESEINQIVERLSSVVEKVESQEQNVDRTGNNVIPTQSNEVVDSTPFLKSVEELKQSFESKFAEIFSTFVTGDHLEAATTTLSEEISTELEAQVGSITENLTALATSLSELNQEVITLSGQNSEISQVVGTVKNDVSAVDNRCDSLESKIMEIDNVSSSLADQIESISTENSSKLYTVNDRLSSFITSSDLSSEIMGLKSEMIGFIDNKADSVVSSVDSKLEIVTTDLDELKTATQSRLDDCKSDCALKIDTATSSLTTELDSIKSNLSSINAFSETIQSQFKDSERILISVIENRIESIYEKLNLDVNSKHDQQRLLIAELSKQQSEHFSAEVDELTIRTHAVREELLGLVKPMSCTVDTLSSTLETLSNSSVIEFDDLNNENTKEKLTQIFEELNSIKERIAEFEHTSQLNTTSNFSNDPIEIGALALRIDSLQDSLLKFELTVNSLIRDSLKKEFSKFEHLVSDNSISIEDLQEQFNKFIQLNAAVVKQMESDSAKFSADLQALETRVSRITTRRY